MPPAGQSPVLRFFTDQQVSAIHGASLRMLTETGIRLEDDELANRLLDHGCRRDGDRIRLTADLVDTALAAHRDPIRVAGPRGAPLRLADGGLLTHTAASIPFIFDPDSGVKRSATCRDLGDSIRLMNHLEQLDMPGALICPIDVPAALSEVEQTARLLITSAKPVNGLALASDAQAPYVVEMFQAVRAANDGHWPGFAAISPESPLYYPQQIVRIIRSVAAAGLPTVMLVAPIAGITGPMTIAGGLAQMNASMLAFATLAHLINPATPLVYGARLAFANMRTANSLLGLPEMGLAGACSVQLARHYGLVNDVYGFSVTACAFDNQAGYEKAVGGILPVLAGADIMSGFGMQLSGLATSLEQLAIDDELMAILRKVRRGVTVAEETLAVDVVAAVMRGGTFLEQEHTLKHLQAGEVFQPRLGFDGLWSEWLAEGETDIRRRAREKVRRLLAEPFEMPVSAELADEIRRIAGAARRHLVG